MSEKKFDREEARARLLALRERERSHVPGVPTDPVPSIGSAPGSPPGPDPGVWSRLRAERLEVRPPEWVARAADWSVCTGCGDLVAPEGVPCARCGLVWVRLPNREEREAAFTKKDNPQAPEPRIARFEYRNDTGAAVLVFGLTYHSYDRRYVDFRRPVLLRSGDAFAAELRGAPVGTACVVRGKTPSDDGSEEVYFQAVAREVEGPWGAACFVASSEDWDGMPDTPAPTPEAYERALAERGST